ncbi:class I SAM-dependent methyltransferase [Brevibacillus brevis]|uniref:Class I SAM-dependent methyltransferase n=1 Tax=Brevibacillus brevis TaxID=1393 RepID=A0ABY9T2X4_BREBE|nr:class I SAM-dependent methyltransferase [Brevibacillus brevis]WNC14460.1 class I SAM-dependent methyltransferase [Brevibacillus brevis]
MSQVSRDGGKEIWDEMWAKENEIDENVFFKCVVDAVIENMNVPIQGAKILEAGAGTGTSSFQLAKLGATVTLVDYSENSIQKMKRMFDRHDIPAKFYCNDIRSMDIENDTYDVVFNSGVLEHFSFEDQVLILRELKRICKPGGRVITLNPNAKSLLYRCWKWILESSNRWPYGYEQPVITLKNQFEEVGLAFLSEYSVGFDVSVDQFGSFSEFQLAASFMRSFYHSLPDNEKRLMEGYLLCSVGEK